jgi:hypothetical protein
MPGPRGGGFIRGFMPPIPGGPGQEKEQAFDQNLFELGSLRVIYK